MVKLFFYVAFYHSRDLKPENILLDDNGKSINVSFKWAKYGIALFWSHFFFPLCSLSYILLNCEMQQ